MSSSNINSSAVEKPPPALNIPSGSTVSVKIIDNTTILYDLGTRKDLENLAPVTVRLMDKPDWKYTIEKDVADILVENGVVLNTIEAVVWSHWHFDHTGNMKTFPPSVNLIVGSGFKKGLLPGYPTNKNSHVLEADWEVRDLIELDFNTDLKLGKFKTIDYFSDGSFYLLDTPGHAIGHTSALARVSKGFNGEKDTFVFLGGDLCHHEFDAADNVLVIIAHDSAPLMPSSGFQFFPDGTLNNWKKDKLDEKIRWSFLTDFSHAVENGLKQETTLKAGLVFKPN
ncbi:metallo-beta-lactamase superfamily protein [Grosmannia clavigera kw1407]|uniref:Metallo-beta-lactamase superfamily protein n=1 Tax=Grosmannia clavigera (strain kw1407 / UAMH 11150) TaxID=655863 RepID=F0XEM0_GROCL|nr:metallo-beta-lactamase superfamily protein [Grosmannia clavigera kw1407]EFX03459.1 metallo-beta-lactamase superfamily protein [Grosmannia clavigera kw1407]